VLYAIIEIEKRLVGYRLQGATFRRERGYGDSSPIESR